MAESLQRVEAALLDAALALYGSSLVSLAVFGSWPRGKATPASDIDVLAVVSQLPPSRMKRVKAFLAVEDATREARGRLWGGAASGVPPPELSPVIKTPGEAAEGSPLFLGMTEHVHILFDEGGFLAGLLGRLRDRMAFLGTRKVPYRGGYYWHYKPGREPGEVVEL